ncbi:putative Zinc binding protein Ecl1/2/3 [Septoria linicola]|nr:putative Zinc binding protein Ecl1/2/3 [Septoria linicola]
MNQRHHARQPSQGRKVLPPHARPSRPAPLTQRKSYNNAHGTHGPGHVHTSSTGHAQTSPKKTVGSGWSTKAGAEEDASKDDEEESGMASFLQFCMTCERQIVTPNSSILYCSEACRRRDSRPPSLQEVQSIQQSIQSPPPMSSTNSYFDQRIPEIVPRLSPTVLRPMSRTFSDLSLSDSTDSASSDQDPSETRRDSAATDYLQQFYTSFNSSSKHQHHHHCQRPRADRTSTTSTGTRSGGDSNTNLPSLSHSPSSSYGTIASNASYRPVMKHNPFSSTFTTKSVELVIPYPTMSTSPTQLLKDASLKSSASTLTSFRVAEANDISYDASSPTSTTTGSRRQSQERADYTLKQLFSHDAMKAKPSSRKHD